MDFVYRILVLFHRNAAVERSFSFNNKFLVENLDEQSLVAQRSVHDFVMNEYNGKVAKIVITKEMICSFKSANSRRIKALKKPRK